MQIKGEWYLCDDAIERPVIRGEIRNGRGSWEPAFFLVDTGADRTVVSADLLAVLHLPEAPAQDRLGGLGGLVRSVSIETAIQFPSEGGSPVAFRSQFAAVTELEALDMSVLGRDITGLFAVIVDRPGDVVCLVGQRHQYSIAAS